MNEYPPEAVAVGCITTGEATIRVVELRSLDLPFHVQRVYSVADSPVGFARGFHAHKRLWQLLYCAAGAFEFQFEDGRTDQAVKHVLHANGPGLVVGPLVWRTYAALQDHSMLVALVSEPFDPDEYIREKSEFIQLVTQ